MKQVKNFKFLWMHFHTTYLNYKYSVMRIKQIHNSYLECWYVLSGHYNSVWFNAAQNDTSFYETEKQIF